ncbi:tetratricopeptide repeat protein [Leptospira sp. 201903070]|uniref:Tetratricopeptide repeat protein n=1 Tax=Leptospira ainlahdjerensis TaxID=2810033 RepID=A0ABS2U7M3_9LEPT|nr:tetratricopeptide repeat protein [Leptospira ainlahdjerensis]MBM9576361.1 tetratricopeptide repeat protein [Leptospira ainlahdjerensis]
MYRTVRQIKNIFLTAMLLTFIFPFSSHCQDKGNQVNQAQALKKNQEGVGYIQTNPELSMKLFKEAQALDPRNPDFPNNIGVVLLSQGKFKDAIPYFVRATEIDSKYVRGFYNEGVCFQNLQKNEEAVLAYGKALKLTEVPEVYFNLGIVHTRLNQKEKAIEAYQKFISIAPATMAEPISDAKAKIRALSSKD